MNANKTIETDAKYMMQTYGRLPIVPSHGKSATLFDLDGKRYIDFTSGIGVNSLGFADSGWCAAVTAQIAKFAHISNYYYSEVSTSLAERLVRLSRMRRVFLCNSGAEANEGAIKLARKYSFDKYGSGRSKILALTGSFHGRTVTTLSATGQEQFHNYFFPFTDGFSFIPPNDFDAASSAMTDDVCAIMLEPIQGESGVNLIDPAYVRALRALCDERDVLLIFDEVQTGVCRSGRFLAGEYFEVLPDIVTLAKGLGGGLPIGAFLAGEKCENVLHPGDHGSTFGGNPVACAGAQEVLSRLTSRDALSDISAAGEYIRGTVAGWRLPSVREVRGRGLMIGIQIDRSPKPFLTSAAQEGLLLLSAGSDVIRLLPPLTITTSEIDAGLAILKNVLTKGTE